MENMDIADYDDEDEMDTVILDSHRYDVAKEKLAMYKRSDVKKKLKSKFITGQGSDQIVQNLLNLSDSEGEQDAEKRKEDRDQLRKIEDNDTKVDKKDKKKKRMEARNEKVRDSESDSEIESAGEEGDGAEGDKKGKKEEEETKGHEPIKKTEDELKRA